VARRLLLSLCLVALTWLSARRASASVVLAKPDGDIRVSETRVAHSVSALRSVAWEQLVLDEARGDLAWVIPVPRGGWIEPGNDHFFESLDESTAAVIAPAKSLQCAEASESMAEPRGMFVRNVGSAYAPLSPAAAIDKLVALGFVVDASTRASLLSLGAIGEDVSILILPAGARGVTKVARVLGPATRAFPTTLIPTARLRAYVMAPGRARFAGISSTEIDRGALSWSSGKSNYSSLLDSDRDVGRRHHVRGRRRRLRRSAGRVGSADPLAAPSLFHRRDTDARGRRVRDARLASGLQR
jgi:hypothetical protein